MTTSTVADRTVLHDLYVQREKYITALCDSDALSFTCFEDFAVWWEGLPPALQQGLSDKYRRGWAAVWDEETEHARQALASPQPPQS